MELEGRAPRPVPAGEAFCEPGKPMPTLVDDTELAERAHLRVSEDS